LRRLRALPPRRSAGVRRPVSARFYALGLFRRVCRPAPRGAQPGAAARRPLVRIGGEPRLPLHSAITIAKALGAGAIAVDVNPDKLALALSVGAEHAIDAGREGDVPARVAELTRGGADVSIDALGSSLTLRQSIESLRKRGRHVQVGLMVAEGPESPIPMGRVIANELVLYGSHGIAARAYPEVFELISRRAIPLGGILGPRIGLAGVPAQLAGMGRFESLGITLVDPSRD
jgi:alcohol dehydrogenase